MGGPSMKRQVLPNVVAIEHWALHPQHASGGRLRARGGVWEPPTDICSAGSTIVLKMELAGVSAEAIDLTVDGRILRVRGERQNDRPDDVGEYRQLEINYGRFERAFEFPFPLGDARLAASYVDGFLSIEVEPGATQPRRIEIETAP